ncbi:MAG: NBR1-Ig-like domain-containing protein [Anaerolineae bacterium]|nr:NBR1-Ig-like domain-containing protein [Anaerolineae bacterium]
MTIPDNTSVETGSTIVMTWRVRDPGAGEWGRGYTLAFVGGDALGEGAPVHMPGSAGVNFGWDPGLFYPILETEILADHKLHTKVRLCRQLSA